jgi:hypothetical protein
MIYTFIKAWKGINEINKQLHTHTCTHRDIIIIMTIEARIRFQRRDESVKYTEIKHGKKGGNKNSHGSTGAISCNGRTHVQKTQHPKYANNLNY